MYEKKLYYKLYTKILEVNLFAFAYRLFPEDFSPIHLWFQNKSDYILQIMNYKSWFIAKVLLYRVHHQQTTPKRTQSFAI